MNCPVVYLAGPIAGCTEGEAKDWRAYMDAALKPMGIICISPLRCHPLVGETYELHYADPCFGQLRAILAKNFMDTQRADFVLAYFPEVAEGKQRSAGTIGEISWAYAMRKPLAVVSKDPFILNHPFTSQQAGWPVLESLDDAIRLLKGLFAGYVGGKNL